MGDVAALFPGLPSPRSVSYVIAAETNAPHHTLASAQNLPDVPYFGVVGSIVPGDPIDLYRMTLGAGATGVDFGLVSRQSAPTVPLQFWLYDGSGRLLGEWSTGGPGIPSFRLELGAQPAGSTLYLGITAGNPGGSGGPSAAVDYQLWVGRQPAAAVSPAPASGGAAAPPPTAVMPGPTSPHARHGPGAIRLKG
jgi:hypothetical protein